MSNWISIKDRKPLEGMDLFYFFDVLGIYTGRYEKYEWPVAEFGTDDNGNPFFGDTFYSESGFLTDDVTHWMYDSGQYGDDQVPPPPEGYMELSRPESNRKYGLLEEAVAITKHQFDQMEYELKLRRADRVIASGCCPDHEVNCCHWDFDKEAYVCVSCQKEYTHEHMLATIREKTCMIIDCDNYKMDGSTHCHEHQVWAIQKAAPEGENVQSGDSEE